MAAANEGKVAIKCQDCDDKAWADPEQHDEQWVCYSCKEKRMDKARDERERQERAAMMQAEKEYRTAHIQDYVRKAGVGRRYMDSSFENFHGGDQYVDFLKQWMKSPTSLYMFGPCGCGKTHLSAALCRELILTADSLKKERIPDDIQKQSEQLRKFYNYQRCFEDEKSISVFFINAQELFLQIRASFDTKETTEQEIVNRYSWQEFLFIDDMGADKTSEWSRATMYTIIDRRDRELLPTIITSNLSPAEIGTAIDGRISSRISNGKIIELKMPDYRKRR